jgi:hypothetical protein
MKRALCAQEAAINIMQKELLVADANNHNHMLFSKQL